MAKKIAGASAAILAVGSELFVERPDTNGPALTAELGALGFATRVRMILPDDLRAVAEAVAGLVSQHRLIVCCGGLGPTQDDVTRQAIAQILSRPLQVHPEGLDCLQNWFSRLRRPMPASNRIQAMLPQGSLLLPNHWGTAQGFITPVNHGWVVALPGPPRECLPMFAHGLKPFLLERAPCQAPAELRTSLRICGVAEALLQEQLGPLFQTENSPQLGFLLDEPGEILVKLSVHNQSPAEARRQLNLGRQKIVRCLGEKVVDAHGRDLPAVIGQRLFHRRQTVAVAESCTGGLIARRLTQVAGSSRYFQEGVVAYSHAAKTRQLGVPAALLARQGAVSAAVAEAMARGLQRRAKTDWTVAVTGIAGPGGGTRTKPVGLVYLALARPGGQVESRCLRQTGDRDYIQRRSATAALDWLRRAILEGSGRDRHARVRRPTI